MTAKLVLPQLDTVGEPSLCARLAKEKVLGSRSDKGFANGITFRDAKL
jgi:hypothetical protein